MFLSKLKKLFSSKLTALFAMGAASVGTISCVYGPEPQCCDDYTPNDSGVYSSDELLAYEQMCLSVMDTNDKYDRNSSCKLKMADRYVFSAEECCASIKSEIGVTFVALEDFSDSKQYDYYYISTSHGSMNTIVNGILMPTNAYTFCLFNTDPFKYRCDVDKAIAYENSLNQCCEHTNDKDACIKSFVINNNECNYIDSPICCDGLPEEDDEIYVAKSKCEDIYNSTNVCIETMLDACCRNVPDTSSNNGITKQMCKDIYTESSGTCVNDDEKYQQYLDSHH